MKTRDVLAHTPLKVTKLLRRLDAALGEDGDVGFDTEAVGPLLQGQDFINISYSALLGLSVAFEDGSAYYLPLRHKGTNASFHDLHKVCERLRALALAGRLWAHNAKFDHQMMIRSGYPLEGLRDSMLAAWLVTGKNVGLSLEALGEKGLPFDPTIGTRSAAEVLAYACQDARGTLALAHKFLPELEKAKLVDWFAEECAFAHSLAEMKLLGIGLDRDKLRTTRSNAEAKRDLAAARWKELAGDLSITSSKQLQDLFESGLWRTEKRTKTGVFSTDAETMQEQVDKGTPGAELAQLRLDFQAVTKVVNTYTDGLIEESLQWADKKLHPDLFHLGTVTGRLSSSHPNIQNQPSHGDYAKLIKSCYIPDPGFEFTSADYSQIELRYFADYCGGDLLQAFIDGKDLHSETGEAMGVGRDGGKTVNFGFLLYGGGASKLARTVGVPEERGEELLALLHAKYPRVEAWRRHVIDVASKRGPVPWVRTRAGRIRYIPELQPEQWKARDPEGYTTLARHLVSKYKLGADAFAPRYGKGGKPLRSRVNSAIWSRGCRLVVNYLVQGGSRDLLVIGMNDFRARAPEGFSIVTTVHDEVLTQHPIGRGEEARALLKECLEGAGPKLGLKVPVLAEPKTGPNWFATK
jgi:DNA polymerase-1